MIALTFLNGNSYTFLLQTAEKHQKISNKHALQENVQLLQELQVSQQDSKAMARQLDSAHSELRDLQAKYKILEARTRGAAPTLNSDGVQDWGGSYDAEDYSAPRGAVSIGSGRVAPSRPSSAYPATNSRPGSAAAGPHVASSLRSSWAAAGSSPSSRPGSAVAVGRPGSAVGAGRPSSAAYRCEMSISLE